MPVDTVNDISAISQLEEGLPINLLHPDDSSNKLDVVKQMLVEYEEMAFAELKDMIEFVMASLSVDLFDALDQGRGCLLDWNTLGFYFELRHCHFEITRGKYFPELPSFWILSLRPAIH